MKYYRLFSAKDKTKQHHKNSGSLVLVLTGLLCLVGLYIIITALAPAIVRRNINPSKINVESRVDQIIIPKVGIQEQIYTGGVEALEKGVWHRLPERGKPGSGNFILSAHRFVMGRWPGETIRKSPFYHLGHLRVGDSLYIDWSGRRFNYIVSKTYQVKPNATYIEAPSAKPKLTLYSCTLNGSADGRLVIEAVLKP